MSQVALALGGVATVQMQSAEQILTGARLDDATIDAVAHRCTKDATPLPETGYKVDLIAATVRETLERLRPFAD